MGLNRKNLNIETIEQLRHSLSRYRSKYVINCIALTDVNFCEQNAKMAYEINAILVSNLAQICGDLSMNLIHVSTDFVFDGKDKTARKFDSNTNPISIYGKSKLEGEQSIQINNQCENTILRTGALYGGHRSNFVKYVVESLKENRYVNCAFDQLIQPTHVGYIATIVGSVVANNLNLGIFHSTSTGLVSKYDFAIKICKILDLDSQKIKKCDFDSISGSTIRPKFSNLEEDRLDLIGMKATPNWEEMLDEYSHTILGY